MTESSYIRSANDMENRNGTRSEDLVKPVSAGNLLK